MRKISKKTREDAITLCLLRADHWIRFPGAPRWDNVQEFKSIGASQASIDLFWNAYLVIGWLDLPSMADDYLEAAALLRDGWCPGEPIRGSHK